MTWWNLRITSRLSMAEKFSASTLPQQLLDRLILRTRPSRVRRTAPGSVRSQIGCHDPTGASARPRASVAASHAPVGTFAGQRILKEVQSIVTDTMAASDTREKL